MTTRQEQVSQKFLAAVLVVDIYCRVSTAKQEGQTTKKKTKEEIKTSLDTQERDSREYCQEHGLVVGMVHREVYTGSKYRERKDLSLMRSRYKAGEIQGVVIWTFDRLARNQMHFCVLYDEMKHHDVKLFCVKEVLDDTPMGQFVASTYALVAEMERAKTDDRTHTGRINKTKQGSMKAASTYKPLYGYRWHDPLKKDFLIEDEDEARICRWLAEEFDKGMGISTLEKQLLADGTPASSSDWNTTKDGKVVPRGQWNRMTIYRILTDVRRTGKGAKAFTKSNERSEKQLGAIDLPDGSYPKIIEEDLFARIQIRLAHSKQESTRNAKDPEQFLLRAGYIKCTACGWNMTSHVRSDTNGLLYRCVKTSAKKVNCPGQGVNASKLDALVWADMEKLAEEADIIERAVLATMDSEVIEGEIETLANAIASTQELITQYQEDLRNPILRGNARNRVLADLSNEEENLASMQRELLIIQAGAIDLERIKQENLKILAKCRQLKQAREAFSYKEKRDFLWMIGAVVYLPKTDRKHGDIQFEIRVKLPQVRAILDEKKGQSAISSVTQVQTWVHEP